MTLMGSYMDIDELLGYEISETDKNVFKGIYMLMGLTMSVFMTYATMLGIVFSYNTTLNTTEL
jgi:hypothetical protein